jgi:uncharacterized coiled-coil DUF342 family protein
LKHQGEFFAEASRLVNESASALREAQPLLLLKASESLSQLIAKWHKAEFVIQETDQLKAEILNLQGVIEQLKVQQKHVRQQSAQVEKQLKVLLPGWTDGLYTKNPGQGFSTKSASTSVRA